MERHLLTLLQNVDNASLIGSVIHDAIDSNDYEKWSGLLKMFGDQLSYGGSAQKNLTNIIGTESSNITIKIIQQWQNACTTL